MMAPDGYHPGPVIYDRWAELAADLIVATHAAATDGGAPGTGPR